MIMHDIGLNCISKVKKVSNKIVSLHWVVTFFSIVFILNGNVDYLEVTNTVQSLKMTTKAGYKLP